MTTDSKLRLPVRLEGTARMKRVATVQRGGRAHHSTAPLDTLVVIEYHSCRFSRRIKSSKRSIRGRC